jgi:Tol biopolymer transport system component
MTVLRDDNWDVWVYDLERGVSTRLTFDDAIETEQIWSPDGESLIFSSDRDGADSLYRKRADGSGDMERLTEARHPQFAASWSPDGRFVLYMEAVTQYDLHLLDLSSGETRPFLVTDFGESFPAVSPDGRFVAYTSNETGDFRIYVRPFPQGEGKWQVSDAPGSSPRWRADGRELLWRSGEGIVAATVDLEGPTFRAGKPRQLFSGRFQGGLNGVAIGGFTFADFEVTADGQRFVMFPEADAVSDHQHLTLVTGWFDQLASIGAKAAP